MARQQIADGLSVGKCFFLGADGRIDGIAYFHRQRGGNRTAILRDGPHADAVKFAESQGDADKQDKLE